MPKGGEKDPHIHLGKTKIHQLLKSKLLKSFVIGGTRVLDGASKCAYLRNGEDGPSTNRGGNRRKPGPVAPSAVKLTPPILPLKAPALTPCEGKPAPIAPITKLIIATRPTQ